MADPLVSFIIPCYNQGEFLYEAISSIKLSYSGSHEIIIINDCSTLQTTNRKIEEIQTLFKDIQVIEHHVNKGLASSRNTGIKASKGEFIQFLDADDMLFPKKVDLQIEHFRISAGLDISITDYYLSNEDNSDFHTNANLMRGSSFLLNDFLFSWERGFSIPIHCALFRREIVEQNLFEETLSAKEDWVFWCSLAFKKKKMAFINSYGVIYRQHAKSMTKDKICEMGRMWLKAALRIDEIIKSNESDEFLINAVSWYVDYYSQSILREKEKQSEQQKKDVGSKVESDEISDHIISRELTIEMTGKPFFSVVIPVYNHYGYLKQCIESVLSQGFKNFEIVCIDDCSTDRRVDKLLSEYSTLYHNVHYIQNGTNLGISISQNKGIEESSGEFIVFLDCDDMVAENAFELVYTFIRNNPTADYIFTDRYDIDSNGKIIRIAKYGGYRDIKPSGNIEIDILKGMVASHLKVIRRSAIIKIGSFNEELDGVQDYDLALRLVENGEVIYYPKTLYLHRIHSQSVTNSDTVNQFRKANIARRQHFHRKYGKSLKPEDHINKIKELLSSFDIQNKQFLDLGKIIVLNANELTFDNIQETLTKYELCILNLSGNYEQKTKYFVREYNSYFDFIITDNQLTAISVIGCLWSPDILLLYDRGILFNQEY